MVESDFLRPGDGIHSKTRTQLLAFLKGSRRRIKKRFDWSVSHKEWLKVSHKRNALSVQTRRRPGDRRQPPTPSTPQTAPRNASTLASIHMNRGIHGGLNAPSSSAAAPNAVAGSSTPANATWTSRWLLGEAGKGFGEPVQRKRVAQVLERAGIRDEYQVEHLAGDLLARERMLRGLKDDLTLYELSVLEAILEHRRD